MDLFKNQQEENKYQPLAERMRPSCLQDVVGQDHLVGERGLITKLVASKKPASIIFWGPAGCGKTTLARLYAGAFDAEFVQISAVLGGVADIKKAVAAAEQYQNMGRKTVLFVDEIHRFNKAQQDAFLPYIENGTFIFVGATTENPSFELNSALLSRAQVLTIKQLQKESLNVLFDRAQGYVELPKLTDDAKDALFSLGAGDGRYFLGLLETLSSVKQDELNVEELSAFLQKRAPIYDKSGEAHYDLISTLHKSVRGSDVDGALFWFARMLEGGEDIKFLTRRIIRMAVEDIGLADPNALLQAEAAAKAYERLGSPEGELCIAQALVYITSAPKSNAVYTAFKSAVLSAKQNAELPAPMFSRNAPTKLMKEQGYGDGYKYDHDFENAVAGQNFFPDELPRQNFYQPVPRGFERDIAKRLDFYEKMRKQNKKG